MPMGDFLRLSARRMPNKTALVVNGHRLSFRQLDDSASRVANALLSLSLPRHSTIAIQAPNSWEYAAIFFGIARAGHISAHVSLKVTKPELAYMIAKTRARVLFVASEWVESAMAAVVDIPDLQTVVVIQQDELRPGRAGISFDQFVENAAVEHPSIPIAESDPLAITFTGGTTGFPKGVLVSHRARRVTADTVLTLFGLNDTDVVCVSTPLFHAAGLFVVFSPPVLLGCTVVLLPAWDPCEFMRTVQREQVSATLLVPSQLNDLISHPDFAKEKLGPLKKIGYAGAPMGTALFDRIRSALPHVNFTENYGQTETGPLSVRCPWHPDSKLSTTGRPSFNVEIDVFDSAGRSVSPGEIGEIVTRGPHVFSEYWDEPEQTAACFRSTDGWLWTGDLGFVDDDGFVSLVDRSKDMLISGGENIYPAEIENALYRHSAVAECAVFGIPDDHWGEVPAAHVVLEANAYTSENDLIQFCTTLIARHKRPRVVKFVNSLPKTPVGKIQKNILREPYWVGHARKI